MDTTHPVVDPPTSGPPLSALVDAVPEIRRLLGPLGEDR